MRFLMITFCLIILNVQLIGQSFGYDATFKPYFDITGPSGLGGGLVSSIWEDKQNGKLMLGGSFRLQGVLRINADGSKDSNFNAVGNTSGADLIQSINDTAFALSFASGGAIVMDTTGKQIWPVWDTNKKGTVKCAHQKRPFFFNNGSSLLSKRKGINGGCRIFQPPDTFPHRYIIKIDSLGLWDSTFRQDANQPPRGFKAYDSSRIWVYGHPGVVTHYDSVQVDGLFRIYHDGTLDTTFKSPLLSHFDFRTYEIGETEEDGKFILYGIFYLSVDSINPSCMARFHADGSLDSTFNNYGQNYSVYFQSAGGVAGYAKTEDKGYLIGGGFDTLQGVAKNAIAKLDSNGNLESQYFTGEGPDSAWNSFGDPSWVSGIYKSAFGGYYVTGDFQKWDGKPVQPIVRLKGLLVGEEEIEGKDKGQKLKVETYPNPTSQNLHILIGQQNAIQELRLYDLLGKLQSIPIVQKDNWNYTLSLKNLPQGIYILYLQAKDGSRLSRKVIKQ